MFGVRHARTPPAEMITYTCISTSFAIKSVARSAIMYITMPAWVFPPQLIEVMQINACISACR